MSMSDPWITTYSGRQFIITHATVDDIYIEDIAHALSNECRYCGHCRVFYSVAEHSCRLCDLAPTELKLAALMDDAAEAYLHDMPSLIKRYLLEYQELERGLRAVIFSKYGVASDPRIKVLENKLLAAEVRDLMNINPGSWYLPEPPIPDIIAPWSPKKAEKRFLKMFRRLYEHT